MVETDTIFALSSGRPPAAIAVVRISGPRARFALEAMIGKVPEPRWAVLARVHDADGASIDSALALFFPGPHSETGEDMAELQLHGGRAIVAAVLATLGGLDGFRPADAGEFTRRAFANGKLDLTAVEGLADLIYAETEAQRRQAYGQYAGRLGRRAEAWRARLVEALALVEARIDFADEGDVPDNLVGPALASARTLRQEIAAALIDDRRGERLRDGLVVAIAGPPNAGKSSLMNRVAQREAAIVTPVPGTTRDVIEVHLDLDGYPVTVLDTAGIRETDDPVEQEGVRRARARAAAADLVLWVVDAALATSEDEAPAMGAASLWMIRNKIDLVDSCARQPPGPPAGEGRDSYAVSALTGAGIDDLVAALAAHARDAFGSGEDVLISRERHRMALRETVEALDRALAEAAEAPREDIVAEELRLAARALGRLTGRVDVEEILEVIFRDFCVGK